VHQRFREYRATLQDDPRHLLERFEIIDMARKVVGVGSVGTRVFMLLQGRDPQDPRFLQVKAATRPVLEDHLPTSRCRNPGYSRRKAVIGPRSCTQPLSTGDDAPPPRRRATPLTMTWRLP
jgi:uncharacterized protein (DUF2252 family)